MGPLVIQVCQVTVVSVDGQVRQELVAIQVTAGSAVSLAIQVSVDGQVPLGTVEHQAGPARQASVDFQAPVDILERAGTPALAVYLATQV